MKSFSSETGPEGWRAGSSECTGAKVARPDLVLPLTRTREHDL